MTYEYAMTTKARWPDELSNGVWHKIKKWWADGSFTIVDDVTNKRFLCTVETDVYLDLDGKWEFK